MAEYGDGIRKYIRQLASARVAKNATEVANVQTTNKLTTMEAEKNKLPSTIANMANKIKGDNINPNSGESGGSECETAAAPEWRNPVTWERTAALMVFIQLDSTTIAQPAAGKSPSTQTRG